MMVILVGGWPIPLKNMSSSDWIIIPATGKNKSRVPNHQPVIVNRKNVRKIVC